VIPTVLKGSIDKQLASGLDYSDVWKFVINNDILLSEVNEVSVVAKAPTIKSQTRNNLSRPSSSTIRNTTSHNATNSSRSIFDRLMPRDKTLSNTDELNLSMGFRRARDRNVTANGLIKPKVKSVVTKIFVTNKNLTFYLFVFFLLLIILSMN